MHPTSLLLLLSALPALLALPTHQNSHPRSLSNLQYVNLRIEGLTNTIYEAPIVSGPRTITTASGGTHLCDGTNFNANPQPGNTPTDALDAASKLAHFPYDGTYSTTFSDYFITSISTTTQTTTAFWGLLVNYQFTPVGGCQFETKPGDHVLWAFDAFSKVYFLKLEPQAAVLAPGQKLTVTVTDGTTGVPVPGAKVGGVLTGADGKAVLGGFGVGVKEFKAERADSLRSNGLVVVVV